MEQVRRFPFCLRSVRNTMGKLNLYQLILQEIYVANCSLTVPIIVQAMGTLLLARHLAILQQVMPVHSCR